jgi:hypothetical protein
MNLINFLSILVLGFFLGMRHATDPDHVVAITTIVSRYRNVSYAALIGILWGLGHTVTILAVGGGIILFGWVIPTRIGLSMEFSVALMLILLGILNLTGILQMLSERFIPGQRKIHSHSHRHGGSVHTHLHGHDPQAHPHMIEQTPVKASDTLFGSMGIYHMLRPVIVGLVHGLAGSAAVALLVLATIRNPKWAVAYLVLFGVGTMVGMMLITVAMSLPFAHTAKSFPHMNRGFRIASGLVSLGFGLFLVYQIGFANGLFTSHPIWTPR